MVAADGEVSNLADVYYLLELALRDEVPLETVADTDDDISFRVVKG